MVEGWPAMRDGLWHAGWAGWATVAWQSAGNTLFGYAAWGWLLARYPSSVVAPMALLVPVFGMTTASIVLAEPMPGRDITRA